MKIKHLATYDEPSTAPPDTPNALKCPECGSTFVVRLKRPWHQKIFNSQKHYYCRNCKTAFWDKR